MVRIDIASSGAVSIRELDQPRLDDSMTVVHVADRGLAHTLIVTCCKLACDDDMAGQFGGEGYGTQVANGYSGYLFPLPHDLPADDKLAVVQEAFQKVLARLS